MANLSTLTSGSSVVLTVADQQTIVLNNGRTDVARLSITTGPGAGSVVTASHNGRRVYGPFGAGTITLAAVSGDVRYELSGDSTSPLDDDGQPLTATENQTVRALVSGAGSQYPILATIPGLVAFWDFSEPRAPYCSKAGSGGPLPLRNGSGSRVAKGTAGPLGQSVVFNGTSDYLYIPAAEVGALNIGANGGNAVTVIAWWKRSNSSSSDFIAGCWDESGSRRQYGLFVDLPVYGGDNKVCFHVSRNGAATPGYPFSRDYANSNGTEPSRTGEWIAGTYDGAEARAYLEALFEPYPSYTDGLSNTYAKNPYVFTAGLNTAATDFHVGANPVTPTWNFAAGELGCLAVYSGALTQAQIAAVQAGLNPLTLGFRHSAHQWNQAVTGVNAIFGMSAYFGATATDQSGSGTGVFLRTASGSPSQHFIYRSSTSSAGIGLFTITNLPPGLTTGNLRTLAFQLANANTGDTVRFALKIGSAWYATEATFAVAAASASGSDWSLAETKSITFAKTAASWRDVTLVPGSTLTLAGAARGSDLPDGDITGIGIYSPGTPTGNVRVRNFEIITL